jgi:hypothetical protein
MESFSVARDFISFGAAQDAARVYEDQGYIS